jgi:hypothetical protein
MVMGKGDTYCYDCFFSFFSCFANYERGGFYCSIELVMFLVFHQVNFLWCRYVCVVILMDINQEGGVATRIIKGGKTQNWKER